MPGQENITERAGATGESSTKHHLSPEVEAEIEAAMADLAKEEEASDSHKPKIRGPRVVQAGREHRTGHVVSVGPTDIFIEFGPKELGVLDRSQFEEADLPKVGSEMEVVVNRYDRNESLFLCSRPGTVQKADWEMLQPGQTLEAVVTGSNKGGLELEVAGHRAFMPASQVSLDRINDLSTFVGEKLTCTVSRVDRAGKGNIVLSRRDLLNAERAEKAGKLRETLKEGDVVEGLVRKIMPFGAFVDLGGIDGLVHVSDLTHDRVNMGERNVERFVKEGETVRVQVLKIDWEANRLSLGIKQLVDDPFQTTTADIAEGADLTGRVTKIMEFGAFVEVAPGVEGLVHISELDWRRVAKVEDVIKQDEIITVKVLKIDPDSRRISLSLKQTKEPPEGAEAHGGGGERTPQKRPKGLGDRQGFRRGPERDTRSADEILKETPAMRRLREQFSKGGKSGFKGGLG
ncbi:SSU ribosomal protein S1p [hydrothermal vent metagenome]|uniref:SSU ribosomal protein S1p n=1 Tax=hydrothermal vent metagenome TaxID=652676 RepID=A0A3B1DRD1_9ZZZZ